MKTILHVIDTTGPGGAETVFIELADRLRERNYRSIALIRGKGWVYEELLRRSIESVVLDCKGSFNVIYLKALIALIRSQKVDLIQSHLLGSNVYCSLAGLLTGTPVVATFHGVVDVGSREKYKRIKFFIINCGSSVVTVTKRLASIIIGSTSLWASKVKVIYNGINALGFRQERNQALRNQLSLDPDDLLLGALGNIRPAKAYPVAIKAIYELKQVGINAHLAIAGDARGDLLLEAQELCRQLDVVSQVHFLGFVGDAPAFLAGLDMFILSSDSEGHPLALTQAMAAGLPIVATRCGVEEVLEHNVTGWLVEKNNPAALAQGVVALTKNKVLALQLGQAAQNCALNMYSLDSMLSAYEALYLDKLSR